MSAIGTWRTIQLRPRLSAIGSKADIDQSLHISLDSPNESKRPTHDSRKHARQRCAHARCLVPRPRLQSSLDVRRKQIRG